MSVSELSNARNCELFVGNPGCGKSTLGNALAGQLCFKSGASFGDGLTSKLDIKVYDGIAYVDTPGLADRNKRQAAATAISEALKAGGIFHVIFCCKQDTGRVRAQDVVTIRLVLEACDEIKENEFGIVVNMCSPKIIMDMQDNEKNGESILKRDKFVMVVQQGLPRKTTKFFWLKNRDALADQDNVLANVNELEGVNDSGEKTGFQQFLDQLPMVTLTKGAARDVKASEFEALEGKMEAQKSAFESRIADMEAAAKRNEQAAKDQMKKMKDDFDAERNRMKEEEKEKYTFGSWLGGVCSIFGGDAKGIKRKVDVAFGEA